MKNKRKNRVLFPALIIDDMYEFISDIVGNIQEQNVMETVSQWAERKRSIGKGLTANPGPYDYSLTPYLREIADNLSDTSAVQEIYVIKATQVGFTVGVLENHMGYCIDYAIGPLLYISGDQAMAEESFEKRVDEMIDSAGLIGKIRANIQKRKGRMTGDRTDSKSYGGTFMRAVGPNSESKLRSFPMRILHEDEIDVYPQRIVKSGTDTGDTLKKAERRTDTYGNLKKIVGGSTPKQEGSSRIIKKVEEGDKRYYNVTCPKCKCQQPLVWSQLKWDKDESGKPDIQYAIVNGVETISKDPTYYECIDCKYKIKESEKHDLLQEKGHGGTAEWIPTKKPSRPFVRSYHIPGWYGFRSWWEIALEWYEVKDDPFLLPDFINDVMGETYKESDQKPDEHILLQLAQEYEQWPRGHINEKVLFLTIAADVQQDRLEVGLMGWGRNRQGWLIDYWNIPGNPDSVEDQCWLKLSDIILESYKREDGLELAVQIAFIDSQYLSSTVDLFCDGFPFDPENIAGVYPVQSRETQDKRVKNFQSNIKTPVVGINDQAMKRALYTNLRKRPQGPGHFPGYYLHFSYEYGDEFYKQLTSEEIVRVTVRGVDRGIKILNTKQRRNEVLDVVKYNMAAFEYAIDRYFDLLNKRLVSMKKNTVQQEVSIFFDFIEGLNYS